MRNRSRCGCTNTSSFLITCDFAPGLHLINAGKEGHDFTAPDFFNAVDVRNPEALGAGKNSIYVKPGETADIYFIAEKPGLFAPRCADHDWAGMKATIIVE